jgi:tetratricopeptide (TPR) repeat protein
VTLKNAKTVLIVPFFLNAFLAGALLGCSSLHKAATSVVHFAIHDGVAEHTQGPAPTDAPELYREGVASLAAANFEEALKSFDRFIQQNPASPWSQAAGLNSGRALEGLKNWQEAAHRYQQVVTATAKAPRLQAMALYRLSNVHEALGDDTQVVADLNDLVSRTRFLPQEIAEGEMPARLAAAYARAGNFEKAQSFYQKAEVGLARLRQASGDTVPEWLPRTLFLMGETSHSQLSWADFETFLRPLTRSQIYLLQAAELGESPYSDRAALELISVYNDLFSTIESAPVSMGDPLLAKRALQHKQWERAALLIECLTDLRARALPEYAHVPQVEKIQAALNSIDQKIAALLEERPAGEGLTAAAIARRQARILKTEASDDSLERQFLKSSREVKQGHAFVPSPAPSQQPSTNLPPGTGSTEGPEPIRATPSTKSAEDPNL